MTAQAYTPEGVSVLKGETAFSGITAAIDGTTNTQLDITCTATAWAVLGDGTLLSAQQATPPTPNDSGKVLASTSLSGLTVNGTYTLWLDHDVLFEPLWTVVTAAPSTSAIAIATVVVAGNVLSSVTPVSQQYAAKVLVAGLSYQSAAGTVLGSLPANAVIDAIIPNVSTVFNAGTTNTLSIGKSGGSGHEYLNASSLPGTAGPSLPAAQTVGSVGASAVKVTATYAQSGTAATAGTMSIAIFWHQP